MTKYYTLRLTEKELIVIYSVIQYIFAGDIDVTVKDPLN
jgi:hypothetical protein